MNILKGVLRVADELYAWFLRPSWHEFELLQEQMSSETAELERLKTTLNETEIELEVAKRTLADVNMELRALKAEKVKKAPKKRV